MVERCMLSDVGNSYKCCLVFGLEGKPVPAVGWEIYSGMGWRVGAEGMTHEKHGQAIDS